MATNPHDEAMARWLQSNGEGTTPLPDVAGMTTPDVSQAVTASGTRRLSVPGTSSTGDVSQAVTADGSRGQATRPTLMPASEMPSIILEDEPEPGPRRLSSFPPNTTRGVLMIVAAVVWFVLGWEAGYIFFYPPILLALGVGLLFRGMNSDNG